MQVNQDAKPYDTINVTPMLDLAYVLLVVFILMTTASVQGMSITMPKPSNKPSTEKHELKIVQVMPDGGVRLNGVGVSLAELERQLDAAKARNFALVRSLVAKLAPGTVRRCVQRGGDVLAPRFQRVAPRDDGARLHGRVEELDALVGAEERQEQVHEFP